MWLKWLPWRWVIRSVARRHGFLDPLDLLARLQRFAQPSEVAAPLELVRAGAAFHARGLVNAAVVQHNLDWVWPYWIERQFDPGDVSFIPRAFSLTHVNLTHRTWTAIGMPDDDHLPLVDPRGLLTPWWDGWSLDAWLVAEDGRELVPSRARDVVQQLDTRDGVGVLTAVGGAGLTLESRADVVDTPRGPACRQRIRAHADAPAWLVVSLRPANPEGVSFVHEIALEPDRRTWRIDGRPCVRLDHPVERHLASTYREGDVHARLRDPAAEHDDAVRCEVGLATAAALYAVAPGRTRELCLEACLDPDPSADAGGRPPIRRPTWTQALAGTARLEIPDERIRSLHDAALRTLVLLSPGDVYPGPYTYKRFWFRDAAFMVHALLVAGLLDRAERALARFPARQRRDGYFLSQDGEWDSNGEALWIYRRFVELAGRPLPGDCQASVAPGARWIARKRLPDDLDEPHAGLLPAGFSAEHLGPNDHYYWDDFWAVAGLEAAAALLDGELRGDEARSLRAEAAALRAAIDRSLERTAGRRRHEGVPAAPSRRMDAGAIGSIAAGYPLQLWAPSDLRLLATVEYLLHDCFHDGGFFQDMVHSGVNPYLTLQCAQVLQRAGDARAADLVHSVARLASPTGQWPEAVHPRTGGGCMGDGQHGWAAAEWVIAMRNAFVREEGDALVVAEGLPESWLASGRALRYGPTPTPFGQVVVHAERTSQGTRIAWEGEWRGEPPRVVVARPGFPASRIPARSSEVLLAEVAAR